MDFLLKGARLVDPQCGLDVQADIALTNGCISALGAQLDCADAPVIDCSGCVIVPGLVDAHVHLREPGFEAKEDIASGCRAAVHGGFVAVCAMPNTRPVTDSVQTVEYVRRRAREANLCEVLVSGACTKGLAGEELSPLADLVAAGAVAFTDDGRGVQDAGVMRAVMEEAAALGRTVMSHCQDEGLVGKGQVNEGAASARLGLAGWPAEGEELQIFRDCQLSRLTGCALHVQHISSARGLQLVRAAKAEGLPVTCEVTPHHLLLNDELIRSLADTRFKVNPPLRTPADNEALIEGLIDDSIDCISTDHAPHTAAEKARPFAEAPFGMIGLETSLALMHTHFVAPGRISWSRLVELMAVNPRRILAQPPQLLQVGAAATLTVFDPRITWMVDERSLWGKSTNSGFMGSQLQGRVVQVYRQGRPLIPVDEAPLLERGE